jgi:hypothetical protein
MTQHRTRPAAPPSYAPMPNERRNSSHCNYSHGLFGILLVCNGGGRGRGKTMTPTTPRQPVTRAGLAAQFHRRLTP